MYRFTPFQMVRIWMIYLISTPLVFLLDQLFFFAEYEGWLVIILSCAIGTIISFFAVKLASYDREEQWGMFGERIVGKWLHKAILILFVFYCTLLLTMTLTAYTDFFGSTYLPGTPNWVVTGGFLLCISLVARSGLQTMIFMADGLFILIFGALLLLLLLSPGTMKLEMSVALLTHWDSSTIWKSVIYVTPWFAEMMLVLIMLPHFQMHHKTMKYVIITKVSACLLILMYWIVTLMNFGPHLSGQLRFPLMELTRFTRLENIIDNLDPVMISLWSSSLFIKCILLLYVAAHLLAQALKVSTHRPFTFLLASLVYVFVNESTRRPAEFAAFSGSASFAVFLLVVQLMPVIYIIVHKIRSRV
ncbi:GerAB/ArcD/ProY family transporter [Brevibacillus reuszeri]|uniref:GerAB/ArcD/ProY family transporter n=1 Tax=Brevibacillus reuszeri TaxID=54915 RepID=UPI000CCC2C33|nr:GerAB/ArcD/ProY family transporter [Brevibacillus reuszeri]